MQLECHGEGQGVAPSGGGPKPEAINIILLPFSGLRPECAFATARVAEEIIRAFATQKPGQGSPYAELSNIFSITSWYFSSMTARLSFSV